MTIHKRIGTVLISLAVALVVPAHAQQHGTSRIDVQSWTGNGITGKKSFAGPYTVTLGTNLSGSVSGSDITLSASATASAAFSSLTASTNSNIGAFAISGGNWDFTAAGLLKLRIAAGLITATNGEVGYDTTNLNWHIWDNGVDSVIGVFPASLSITNGHLVTWSKSGNVLTLNDGGAATSGTVTNFTAGNLSPLFTSSVGTSTTTPSLTFTLSNAAANTIFGNFTGSSAGPSFNAVTACGDSSHALSWVAGTGFGCQAISASATAGGSNTQVQYNNGGALGGIANFTTTGTVQTAKVGGDWNFVDPTDATKAFEFDASGITTATTWTFTVPNSSGTICLTATCVASFNGRTGAVAPTSGDYTAAQVANAVANNSANTYSGGGLQDLSAMKLKPPTSTVGALPSAASSTNLVFEVTDGSAAGDCTVGAGSTRVLCASNGSAWAALGDGGSGGGGTTTNSVTFNNGGAGSASGTSFNGSSPVTVSYNTLGAAAANASTTVNGQTCTLGATCTVSGGTNSQTASYTLVAGDLGKLVVMNCSAACTVTLFGSPTAGYYGAIESIGSTVAAVSLNSKNLNGTTLVPTLTTNQPIFYWSDGTNYFGDGPSGSGATCVQLHDTGTHTFSICGPSSGMTANATLTLPAAGVSAGLLQSDGSGNLSFLAAPIKHIALPWAGCNAGTAAASWNLPATNAAVAGCTTDDQEGTLSVTDGQLAYYSFDLPGDFTSFANAKLTFSSTDVTNGHTIIWNLATACVQPNNNVANPNGPTYNTAGSVTTTIGASAVSGGVYQANITSLMTTGCSAGYKMRLKLTRATDTATNAVLLDWLDFAYNGTFAGAN